MSIQRLKGRDLMAFVKDSSTGGYVVIGYATDTTLTVEADMIETSNPLSGSAKTFKCGRYSWSMEVSRLYTEGTETVDGDSSTVDELDILKTGAEINIGFSKRGEEWIDQSGNYKNNFKRYYGKALIKSIRLNAPVNGLANYNMTLQGTGELSDDAAVYYNGYIPPR